MSGSGRRDTGQTPVGPDAGADGMPALLCRLREAVAATDDLDTALSDALAVISPDLAERGAIVLGADASGRLEVLASTGRLGAGIEDRSGPVSGGLPTIVLDAPIVASIQLAEDPSPTERLLVTALGTVLDAELGRIRVESDLQERVKELTSLRDVQLAIERSNSTDELFRRSAEALVRAMQFPHAARVELYIDDAITTAGVDGALRTTLVADVSVGDFVRGELVVGYVEPLPFLEPEERNLVHAVAATLGMFLGLHAAREQARDSEARLRQVLDGLPSAVLAVNHDLEVELLSAASNFPAPRPIGPQGVLTRWEDEARDVLVELVMRGLEGEVCQREVGWRHGWWDVRVEPQPTAEGTIDHVLVMVLDMTDEHERRKAEARLASLVESSGLAIVGLDRDGTVASWNRGATMLFGWRAQDMVGTMAEKIYVEDPESGPLHDRIAAFTAGALTEGYFETLRRHRDGHVIDVGVHLAYVRDREGAPAGASVIYLDLSQRNAAMQALEASERQFRVIAETIDDVVYRLSLANPGELEYISPAAKSVFGFAPEVLQGNAEMLVRRCHPDQRPWMFEALRDPRSAVGTFRWQWRHADGRWVWLEDNRRLIEQDGVPVALVGMIRDVTDVQMEAQRTRSQLEQQRRISDELRRVDQMKTTFLSAVSHELRTPLTSIVGFAETSLRLVGDRSDDKLLRPYLERLSSNAQRLVRLVDDLLDVDRLTRGDVEPVRVRTDIAELVRNVVGQDHGGTDAITLDLVRAEAIVDVAMMERVVDNLLRNIERHTPTGTRTEVRLRPADNRVILVIEDDGPGIPQEDWHRIFEPFAQGVQAAAAPSPGTGIGLSLVRQFVEVNGGTVTLDDSPLGGARFTITLARVG